MANRSVCCFFIFLFPSSKISLARTERDMYYSRVSRKDRGNWDCEQLPLTWVWPSAPLAPTSFWWRMLRDSDGWLVANSFQFTKVHTALSEPLWNAFRATLRMEFNNNSPQLQSEYNDPRSSWGQLFSYFVLAVFLKALSEGSGRSCGIHILRDWVWGRPLDSRPSSEISPATRSPRTPLLCPPNIPRPQAIFWSICLVAAPFSKGNPHREVSIPGFWPQLKLYSVLWTCLNLFSLWP